jgi:hypothetical protein
MDTPRLVDPFVEEYLDFLVIMNKVTMNTHVQSFGGHTFFIFLG